MHYARAYLRVVSWTPDLPDSLVLPTRLVLPAVNDEGHSITVDEDDAALTLRSSHIFYESLSSIRSLYTTIRSDLPFDSRCEVYYYETHLIDVIPSHHIVGSGIYAEFQNDPYGASCTYMSNGTMSYRGFGRVPSVWSYGTAYGAGDVVGCGFLKRDQSLFFTKNGIYFGSAIPPDAHGKYSGTAVQGPPTFYPQLRFASRTFTARMRVNFGQEPFRFDIMKYCSLVGTRFSKFRCDAAALPSEILHRILTHAVLIENDFAGNACGMRSSDIDSLHRSQLILSRLAMVCHYWAIHSRRELYRCVVLSHQEQVTRFRHLIVKAPQGWSPDLFVQLLGLIDAASHEIGLILLSTLPRRLKLLKTLVWGRSSSLAKPDSAPEAASRNADRYPPHFFPMMPSLFQAFTALQCLTLRGLRFPSFLRFTRLICSIRRLESLSLDDVNWQEAITGVENVPAAWFRRPCFLRRVDSTNNDHPSVARCLGDISWLFVGRLFALSESSHHPPPLGEETRLLPDLEDSDASVVPRMVMSLVDTQIKSYDQREIADSSFVITMEPPRGTDSGASWTMYIANEADSHTKYTLGVQLTRITSDPRNSVSVIDQIDVWLDGPRSESNFHLFCTDLDTMAADLSSFPYLQCHFHSTDDSVAARRILSKVPRYMPNFSTDMLVIHGRMEEEADEVEEGSPQHAGHMANFPSHYWLGDYDTQAALVPSPTHVRATRPGSAMPTAGGPALLEDDTTAVGYSY